MLCYILKKEYLIKKNFKNFRKFYIGSGIFRTIFFSTINAKVLVMSLPDLNTFHIKRSKYPVHYIFIPHSHFNINIWKLPNECKGMIGKNFSNVNTFRVVFNCLGVSNFNLVEDKIITKNNKNN